MAKAKASKKSKAASKRSAKAAKRSVKASKRARKTTRRPAKAAKKAARRPARTASKKAPRRRVVKAKKASRTTTTAPRRTAKVAKKAAAPKTARKAPAVVQSQKAARARTRTALGKKPNLDRERRVVREEEMVPSPPSSLDLDRTASAARTGRAEYEERLRLHTSTGPAMTGGDVDASWEDAETVGDEAPGGDSPTPDQDIVDEIGKALGIEYEDDEELQGGDELAERDRHRWELDPASKDDFDEE